MQAQSDSMQTAAVALAFLGAWAEASIVNCGKIAALDGGRALARAAAAATARGGRPSDSAQIYHPLIHVLAVLARDCPLRLGSCLFLL